MFNKLISGDKKIDVTEGNHQELRDFLKSNKVFEKKVTVQENTPVSRIISKPREKEQPQKVKHKTQSRIWLWAICGIFVIIIVAILYRLLMRL